MAKKQPPNTPADMGKIAASLRQQVDDFWTKVYPAFSREEKLRYWTEQIGAGVHWEQKQAGNPFSVFNAQTLATWRSVEPEFDELLPDIAERLGMDYAQLQQVISGI